MPKRIAILTPVIPPYVGGIGKAAFDEAEMLARNFDVTIFTPKYKYIDRDEEQRGKVKIKYIKPFFAFGNAAVLLGLHKELKNFDIVYLHYPFFGTAEIFSYKLQATSYKLVIRYHMDVVGTGLWKPLFWFHAKFIMPIILKNAEKILVSTFDYAHNSSIKNFLKKHPNKFTEISFGVDTKKFKPESKDKNLLARLNLRSDDKILLFVGGLDRAHYFKGLDILLKTFSYKLSPQGGIPFAGQATSYKLVIVGDGDLRSYYENLAKQRGISDQLRFVGKVSNADLPAYYNLADVFVFPSIDKSEAFGIALIEAMACGKAIIASDLPGVRSLVEDGKNGFLVEPENITSLADRIQSSIKRSEEFGKHSRVLAITRFDQLREGKRLIDVFACL